MATPSKHPIWRRVGKISGWTVGSIIVVPVALVVLVFLALTIRPIRNFAVTKGVAYANTLLDGYTLKVKSVDRIDPWGANVRGIQMFDDKQREIVNVQWVLVRLKPWSLIKNTLTLTRVEVDGVHARIYPADPNKKPKPDEPDSGPSTFVVKAEHVRVRGAEAVLDYDDRTIHALVGTLALGGVYGPKPALALKEAQVRVTADDQMLLRLRTTEGKWSAAQGGRVGIEAQIVDAMLTLTADLPALDKMEPWPIKTAKLNLQNLDRRTLLLLGVKEGEGLLKKVGLTLDAKADGERLAADLSVTTGLHSLLKLSATADDKLYDLKLGVVPTQLAAIATMLPNLKVQGNLSAHATHGKDRMPKKVDLSWNRIAVNDGAFPDGTIRAELPLPIVRVLSVTLVGFEQAFALQGEYDTKHSRGKGAIQFHELVLESVALLKEQGIAGLLDGGLKADVAAKTVSADGKLTVRDFKHPSAQVGALDLALAVSGTLTAPVGHFNLSIDRLAAGDVKLDKLSADALATPRTLSGKFTAVGPDTNMKMELGGQRSADGSLRVQGIGRGVVAKKELRFDLRELHYHDKGLSVQELALFTGKQSVVVNGSLDKQGRIDAMLKLANVDLAVWAAVANVAGLEGMVGGTAKVSGTTSEPSVDANIDVTQVKFKSDLPIDGKIGLKGDLATRKGELKVGLYSSEELGARVEASVAIPKKPADLSKAMKDARVSAKVSVFLPVGQISALAGDQLAGLDGMIDAKLTAEGTLEAPKLDANVSARLKLPEQKGDPVEAFNLTANVDKDQAKVSLWAKDEDGELLSVDGSLAWPGGNPRAALQRPDAFREAKFELAAELIPRRLDTMQGVFAYFTKIYALSLPISAGAKVSFQGEHGNLGGAAQFHATIFGDKLDGRCKLGTTSAMDLDLKLKEDHVDVKIGAKTDGGGALSGTLSSVLALNALNGKDPVFGPAKISLEGKNIQIYKLPGLCNLAGGNASFKADAEGMGRERPKLDLTATIAGLKAPNTESMNVELKAKAADTKADLTVDFKAKTRQVGNMEAHLPLTYAKGSNTPTVAPDAAVQAHVKFDKLLLANVLSFTEALGRIGGSASADLTVSGKLNDPYPEGYVQLEDVNLSVASLAQPFRGVNARIDVKGRSVKLEKLTAHDRDGKLSLEGYATLNKDMSGDGGLYLEANRFPLRQQGTIIGELTMRARLDAKVPKDLKAQAALKIIDGRIWLTGDRGKSVQSLDAHPDIHFADDKTEAETEAEATKTGQPGLVLGLFTIQTQSDLWLEHEDFSLQVGVDIKLSEGTDGPKLEGIASLHRGDLKLLGKLFKLKNGAVRFTGDMPPDPELDIKANFTPPTGQDLVVSVSGRGSSPNIEFSGAASNATEAVAVLSGKGANSQSTNSANTDAASQMAGIASNMTAGLLVMSARRKFGDWVPMISVNTGASGEPNGASAGFDASRLIPPWAKGFARSAYVEGSVGTAAQGGGGGSVGLGVKLEVALPRDFLTTLGYGPGPGWSTDVAWSP